MFDWKAFWTQYQCEGETGKIYQEVREKSLALSNRALMFLWWVLEGTNPRYELTNDTMRRHAWLERVIEQLTYPEFLFDHQEAAIDGEPMPEEEFKSIITPYLERLRKLKIETGIDTLLNTLNVAESSGSSRPGAITHDLKSFVEVMGKGRYLYIPDLDQKEPKEYTLDKDALEKVVVYARCEVWQVTSNFPR